jgi:hypothetical protein
MLADAPLNLGSERPRQPDFDLDTTVTFKDVPSAVVPGGVMPYADALDEADDSVPMTYEADALESRYLLPSASRSRKAAVRRPRGPEFADAEFPTDAWLDAEDDWSLDLPPLPSSAPPSLARPPAATPPEAEPAPADERSMAVQALAAISALPPSGPDTPPTTMVANVDTVQIEATPVAGSALEVPPPTADSVEDEISTVPSQFADEDARPPMAPTAAAGSPALTEAELTARHQRRGRKGRRPESDTPDFIKQAERKALWRNPGVRGVLTGLSLALSLTLVAQVAHVQRDWLAAHQPALKPWLSQWCDWAGCELRLLRQLDQLQVDHAALVRAESEGADRYRLSLVVRNLAHTDLAWPAVDLVLNDANGQIVARRTLKVDAADWLAETPTRAATGVRPPAAIGATATGTLSWSLQLDDLSPAGYTAELFYPPDHP